MSRQAVQQNKMLFAVIAATFGTAVAACLLKIVFAKNGQYSVHRVSILLFSETCFDAFPTVLLHTWRFPLSVFI